MKLTKIPRREWPSIKTGYYYIDRVFHPGTEEHRAVLDARGRIVGAVSYSVEKDRVRVYSLGSIQRGAGSQLMRHVERRAEKLNVPVRLASERSALGFYEQRGYKKLPGQSRKNKLYFMVKRAYNKGSFSPQGVKS